VILHFKDPRPEETGQAGVHSGPRPLDYQGRRPGRTYLVGTDWEAVGFGAVMLVAVLVLLWLVIIPYARG
jgi:hypothetical protein